MKRDDMKRPEPAPVHAPHRPLTDYYQTEQDRQAYLRRIFDDTAADYDRIESLLAWGTGSRYRRQALIRGGLKTGMKVLDVGVGTGLVAAQACILAGDASLVTGVDPSPGMLAASKLPDTMVLIEGRAESLPFPDNHFDFLSMGYALRHISDLTTAFAEFERVLKPGGRLCLLEITKPQSRFGQWLLKNYMRGVIPLLTRFISRQKAAATIWRYFWDSIEACVPPERVAATLSAARLTQVRRHLELGVFSEYQAIKANPGRPDQRASRKP
jgi:demethylmenaquinone methyltransferase/2-methoxy-6-polyprenyl-1,4-benzoquinol methylase